MRRIRWLFTLLLCVPQSASALQLHWPNAATDLTVSQNMQVILLVQADPAELTLPSSWRLLWIADSTGFIFSALDPSQACLLDTARVETITPPQTAADSATNAITAHFCSDGSQTASTAYFIVDILGGSHGKMKVVALNPADTTQVIESNEVTVNGGVANDYAPVILSAGRAHVSSDLRVSAVGVGLDSAPVVQIAAPDTSWHLPLTVTKHSATTLTATARVAADLPPFVLQIGGSSAGTMAVAQLDADTASVLSVQPACVDYMKEINLITHEEIQPKDFAIVASRDSFHVFYIRRDMNLDLDATEKTIGHQRSRDLNTWALVDKAALQVRPGRWDNFHVWAPTIIKKPNDITYYMLYTGVEDTLMQSLNRHLQIQRIGVATSTDLNIWTQDTTWIWEPKSTSWAEPDSSTGPGQQFRDPFVMPDPNPDSTGHYLMFLVGGSKARHPRMVVGLARTIGPIADFRRWYDVGPFWSTDSVNSRAAEVESPHAFRDPSGRWSLYYTGYNPVDYDAIARGDSTTFGRDSAFVSVETNATAASYPADIDSTRWSAPDTLYKALGGDQTLQFWHGTEYLNWAPGYEYLGAYDDNQHAVDISEISWRSSHTYVLSDSCPPAVALGVDSNGGHLEFALSVLGARPSRVPVAFAVETAARMRVRLAIFDVLGRRVRMLLDEEVLPGRRELRWDGRGATGDAVGQGIYFVRLTSVAGQRVARVVLLR
jgi:hypothetical protein